MKRIFNTLSISNKLAVVFLLLLFMMGVGGVVGLYNAGQLAKVTERLYIDSFRRGETLSSIENEFLQARQEMFLSAITSDDASKSYLQGSIDEHKRKIDKLLNDYQGIGVAAKGDQYLADFRAHIDRYWSIHIKIDALSRSGQRDAALALIRMDGNKTFTESINALRKLIKEERDLAYTTYQKSDFFASVIIAVTLAFTVLAIILAGGLWLALTRAIVKPILAIEESAKRIGKGAHRERVPVMTDDEIGNLAVAFNIMAESIENYYATLEKKVEERTDELKHANEELSRNKQELEAANMELMEANRMKSQFLANVSHELRTPLNSIIGFSELLQEKAFGDLNERQLQYVEFVHSSGAHLLQLINNILDLSKIEAGRMELAQEDFPIMEVLGEVLGMIRPLAHKRAIAIESKAVPASPMLHADKAKFKQIMMNLLSNAVKFNNDGGMITVDWEIAEEPFGMKMERFLIFRIRDTGIGIRPEDRARLFKEFEQIDSSVTREYGGTGLGLVLTKRLVELHNGAIWVESEPGKGSTFFVKLPQGTEEIDMPVFTERIYTPPKADTRHLVLIASEGPDINHLLEIYLAGGLYDVFTASDGFDLLRKAREQRPFAIIMGVAIPKKDGWEALKELKSSQDTADIPVIIISSTDNKDLGYALGAFEYMEKPINRERLLNVLERLRQITLARKGALRVLLSGPDVDGLREAGEALEKEGFSVVKARSGGEAVSSARENNPNVIVVQPSPGGDPDFIRSLAELTSGNKTPVIILTQTGLSNEAKGPTAPNFKTVKVENGLFTELLSEIKLVENMKY